MTMKKVFTAAPTHSLSLITWLLFRQNVLPICVLLLPLLHILPRFFLLVLFCRTFLFWQRPDLLNFPLHLLFLCQRLPFLTLLFLLRALFLVLNPLLFFLPAPLFFFPAPLTFFPVFLCFFVRIFPLLPCMYLPLDLFVVCPDMWGWEPTVFFFPDK